MQQQWKKNLKYLLLITEHFKKQSHHWTGVIILSMNLDEWVHTWWQLWKVFSCKTTVNAPIYNLLSVKTQYII